MFMRGNTEGSPPRLLDECASARWLISLSWCKAAGSGCSVGPGSGITSPNQTSRLTSSGRGTFSRCFWKRGCYLLEERSSRDGRVVCRPFLSHAYANEMQMCRGELFMEGPRRVFTQGMSLRELEQTKSTLVLKVSQKKVLGGEMQACCWKMGTSVFLWLGSWGQQVHFTNYLFLWRQHTD